MPLTISRLFRTTQPFELPDRCEAQADTDDERPYQEVRALAPSLTQVDCIEAGVKNQDFQDPDPTEVSTDDESPLKTQGSSNSVKSGIPTWLIRSIRNSLSRYPYWKHARQEDKRQVASTNPIEDQTNISRRVSTYIIETNNGVNKPHPLFIGAKEPPITFTNYVIRLVELTNKWVEELDGPDSFGVRCCLLAVEYLERIDVQLDRKSMHRYFMTTFLVAIKLLYDYYISNSFWAEVAGCPRKQVNEMEVQLCRLLRWDFTADIDKHKQLVQRFIC